MKEIRNAPKNFRDISSKLGTAKYALIKSEPYEIASSTANPIKLAAEVKKAIF